MCIWSYLSQCSTQTCFSTVWASKKKVFSNFFLCIFYVKDKWYSLQILQKQKSFQKTQIFFPNAHSAGICLLSVNNRSARARCEICSKLIINTPERLLLVFLFLTLNIYLSAGWHHTSDILIPSASTDGDFGYW